MPACLAAQLSALVCVYAFMRLQVVEVPANELLLHAEPIEQCLLGINDVDQGDVGEVRTIRLAGGRVERGGIG